MQTWTTTGGTVPGPTHLASDTPNQDSYGALITDDDLRVVAVSDGAGSHENSHYGSSHAIQAAFQEISENGLEVTEKALHTLVERVREGVLGLEFDRVGCTFAIGVVDAEGNWAVAAVGDSFVIVRTESDLQFYSDEDKDYANITDLLTNENPTINTWSGSGAIGLAASSDGLTHSTITNRRPTEGFWVRIFELASFGTLNVQGLFAHMRGQDRIDDDTTLVITAKPAIPVAGERTTSD